MGEIIKSCPGCGQRAAIEAQYCNKCGYQYYRDGEEDRIPLSKKRFKGYLLTDIQLCIGKNGEEYIDRFKSSRKGIPTFNWPMAFFGSYWMCYRKMWRFVMWLAVICLVNLIINGIVIVKYVHHVDWTDATAYLPVLKRFTVVSWGMRILYFIIRGFVGDILYWFTVKRRLDECGCYRRQPVYHRETARRLEEEGGTLSVGEAVGIILALGFVYWIMEMTFSSILTGYLTKYLTGAGL